MGGEGKRDAGELARGDEDTRAVGHRRRNQPDQRGDRPAHRDPVDRNAEQVGEGGTPGGDCRVTISGLRAPRRQASTASATASATWTGGTPMLAVLR
jgi:hypothetical protein